MGCWSYWAANAALWGCVRTTQPHAARTQRHVCMGLTLLSSSAAPANAHATAY